MEKTEQTIKIIEKNVVSSASLSIEERKIFFEELAEKYPHMHANYFRDFAEMQNRGIERSNEQILPTINELLIKKINSVGTKYGIPYLLTPLINDFAINKFIAKKKRAYSNLSKKSSKNASIITKTSDMFIKTNMSTNAAFNNAAIVRGMGDESAINIQGGSLPFKKKHHIGMDKTDDRIMSGMKMKFDKNTLCLTIERNFFTVARDQELGVKGFLFLPVSAKMHISDYINDNIIFIFAEKSEEQFYERYFSEISNNGLIDVNMMLMRNYPRKLLDLKASPILANIDEPEKIVATEKRNFDTNLKAVSAYYIDLLQVLRSGFADSVLYRDIFLKISSQPRSKMVVMQAKPTLPSMLTWSNSMLMKTLQSTLNITIGNTRSAIFADLKTFNLEAIIYYADVLGEGFLSSPIVSDMINREKIRHTYNKFISYVEYKRDVERAKMLMLMSAIDEKLGVARGDKIRALLRASTHKSPMGLLTAAEQTQIKIELKKRAEYTDAVVKNHCKHVDAYRSLRNSARITDIAQNLTQLMSFSGDTKLAAPLAVVARVDNSSAASAEPDAVANTTSTWYANMSKLSTNSLIACGNCKFNLICPHEYILISADVVRAPHQQIRELMNKYIDEHALGGRFYCKICGELIRVVSMDFEGFDQDRVGTEMHDDLRKELYSEVMIALPHFKMSAMINVQHLVNTIISTCYPILREIDIHLQRSKTNSVDDVKNKRRLFACIYVFVFFAHLMIDKTRLRSVEIKFRRPNLQSDTAPNIMKSIATIIISVRNPVINQIEGINNDFIKNKIIDAYNLLKKSAKISEETSEVSKEDPLLWIKYDPIFKYIRIMTSGENWKKLAKYDVDIATTVLKLPHSAKNVTSRNVIFGSAPKVTAAGSLPTIMSGNQLFKYTDDVFTFVKQYVVGNGSRNFLDACEYIRTHSYNNMLAFMSQFRAGKYNNIEVSNIDKTTEENQRTLIRNEHNFTKIRSIRALRPYYLIPYTRTARYQKRKISLFTIYDKNGKKHVWKNTPNGVTCTDCGVARSTVISDFTHDEKIAEKLRNVNLVTIFRNFYKNRCPESHGTHEYDIGGSAGMSVCKKCALHNETAWLNGAQFDAYFLKYITRFQQDRKETLQMKFNVKTSTVAKKEVRMPQINHNTISVFCAKYGIALGALTNIGIAESNTLKGVTSGVEIPIVKTQAEMEKMTSRDMRAYRMGNAIHMFIIWYNQLRYHHLIIKQDPAIVAIVTSSGFPAHRLVELSKLLPDLSLAEYNEVREHLLRDVSDWQKIVDYSAYTIVTMCNRVIEAGAQDTALANLADAFVKFYLKKIMHRESMLMKHGPIDWKQLRKNRGKDYDPNFDPDYDPDAVNDEDNESGSDDDDVANNPMQNNFDVDDDDILEENEQNVDEGVDD